MSEAIVSASDDLTHDGNLLTTVQELLARGRTELETRQRAEKERAERQERERQEKLQTLLRPIQEYVASILPAELLPFVNWKTDDLRDKEVRSVQYHQPQLCVPGCTVIQIPLHVWANDAGSVSTVRIYQGFYTDEWDAECHRHSNRNVAIESLAETLAIARDTWLKWQEYERLRETAF